MDRATTVSDALKRQRLLAAQTIRKANEISPATALQLQHRRSPNISSPSASLYVPSVSNGSGLQQKSLNITELEEDKTIHMVTTPRKYTFEPKEITARSTMTKQASYVPSKPSAGNFLSTGIEEILASSFADNIRCMGRSLRESAASVHEDMQGDVSLPRTADMSKLSCDTLSSLPSGARSTDGNGIGNSNKDPWDMSQPAFDNSWMRDKINELSQMEEASFRAGDHMESRLLEDEMAWEQEIADIPEMNANKRQVSPIKGAPKPQLKDHVDFSCFSGYLAQEDDMSRKYADATMENETSVCSVGRYFIKMSDDLKSIVNDHSPPHRMPMPLIDVTNDIDSPRFITNSKKDQFNKENKENSLSVSYIAKAITSMDLEDSPHNFIHKVKQVHRTKSEQIRAPTVQQKQGDGLPKSYSDLTPVNRGHSLKPNLHQTASLKNESKQVMQNLPNRQLSDTLSFSESMLDASSAVPALPNSKTSSPKSSQSLWANSTELYPLKMNSPMTGAKQKPLVDTFRVSTATKLSEEYMELPSIPRLKETPKCQKNIFADRQIIKPNRKRRSSSSTRQEMAGGLRAELELAPGIMPARSKSPSNRAELKAASASTTEASVHSKQADRNQSYYPTPKIPHHRRVGPLTALHEQGYSGKSHLSPEPRTVNRSPYSSPKSVAISEPSERMHEYNISVPVAPTRSASQCSGSTEWSHRGDGTLPLKATHSELSWGSTRLRKSEKKTLQIKNTSNRKLLVKAVIVGPGYQLHGAEQSDLLTLQSQECRTITVDFCPTVIGPAIGALSFHPPNDTHMQRVVSLYGFGGEASVKIEGIQKGPTGPFLELGSVRNLSRPLEKSFSLYNKGSLPAFARIGIDKKGLDQALFATVVYVHPQRLIIPPNSYAHVKVVFKPRRQEITKILQKHVDVLTITNLHILWGDEPARHRIRKTIELAKQNELLDPKMGALETICNQFSDEQEPDGLEMFCEQVFDTIHELFQTFREYELVLTIDRALDETMIDLSIMDGNDTLFKTMYASSESGSSPRLPEDMITPVVTGSTTAGKDHVTGPPIASCSGGGARVHKRDSGESWSVRPTMLEFQPSSERTKQFIIKSNFYTAQYFELNCNYRQLFRLSPAEGHIRPGQEVVVNVSLQHSQPAGAYGKLQTPIFVVVYIENEKINIPVHILP
ncbi:uncharacterized protein LOC128724424 [Anopheles nili]|uniref:uncharacterized protein LOC128724424 n=1 Tax=Anopheles nili TaxID=185578 RepID=UPI00237AE91F|nr:uncharacterized protein LOC128724424 [Anopheles nili]